MNKLQIISDKNLKSIKIKKKIIKNLNKKEIEKFSNLIIVIGGDGFMLQTLKKNKNSNKIFYGINSGNYGFLMNKPSNNLNFKNMLKLKIISISPLEMTVFSNNKIKKSFAINEVSILRQSRQAANLLIKKNSKCLIKKLVSDGVLVSTPAGSTAYNLSVNGPILSLNSKKISIAPISAFRPRSWTGKVVSDKSKITIININPIKRPISAVADNFEVRNAKKIIIKVQNKIKFKLLYDKSQSLQKKIKIEQLRKKNLIIK
jgi:NAD+ kinase